MKLKPSGRKGIFVGYNETSKAFRIYIPSFKQIETNRDVTFDENEVFNKSRRHCAEEVLEEEPEAPRATKSRIHRPRTQAMATSPSGSMCMLR